jgi:Zn-finger nucleic acid-binding protein
MSGLQGYRRAALACPLCPSELLEERAAGEALVDICPACGGVWVDWFDGELTPVVRDVAALGRPSGRERPPEGARGHCPRCAAGLYGDPHAGDSLGPLLLRCGECAGSFVPRDAFDAIATFEPGAAPEPPAGAAGFWRRLVEVVRALLRP